VATAPKDGSDAMVRCRGERQNDSNNITTLLDCAKISLTDFASASQTTSHFACSPETTLFEISNLAGFEPTFPLKSPTSTFPYSSLIKPFEAGKKARVKKRAEVYRPCLQSSPGDAVGMENHIKKIQNLSGSSDELSGSSDRMIEGTRGGCFAIYFGDVCAPIKSVSHNKFSKFTSQSSCGRLLHAF
jgi:hypothetical protein